VTPKTELQYSWIGLQECDTRKIRVFMGNNQIHNAEDVDAEIVGVDEPGQSKRIWVLVL
jgi:hypothetical protein